MTEPDVITFKNIAAYKFVVLGDLSERRQQMLELCRRLELLGTVLLSPEGINLFLAGLPQRVDLFLEELRRDSAFADLEVKESSSDHQPFSRMLVKIKKEIIPFGVAGVDPTIYTSSRVSPQELKHWLDQGRPVRMLDVRNDYELEVGTFRGAIDMHLDDFRNFPDAVARLPEELKEQPVVTFCTGGIRCEKAAPYLEQAGFKSVYQLDGGILKYFEECGGAHYDGECFVFDKRVALDPQLEETDTSYCFACQGVLQAVDRARPEYVLGESCHHCWERVKEREQARLRAREEQLRRVSQPLPGSHPYENHRPLRVPERMSGFAVIDFLAAIQTRLDRADWLAEIEQGYIRIDGSAVAAAKPVLAGQRVIHVIPSQTEPRVCADIRWIYEDDGLVVVDKPAPLPMHAGGRFNRNTLSYLLDRVYTPQRLRIVHRLDAETTGVVVLARTREVAKALQQQFEGGSVNKVYRVEVHGCPSQQRFVCQQPISAAKGESGRRRIADDGLPARTEFEVLSVGDGTTQLRAIPITGRTHQIRLHLAHLGFSVVGDSLYGEDAADSVPLALHATELSFEHPRTQQRMTFASPRVSGN